ncbi:MAG: 2-C-methyl-D-erythritol 2,4-cyclodiphosphate synthase [Cyclobacteriaceae bacterium]|nr:2-C-methyl-D-erythritol 2,4-cyclodiphosphate synthase [Cyclobacteriaceae bacterium]
MKSIRIGQGYDVHKLEPGRPFWLGGIEVPHNQGAVGHSDADVLIHVICDALLGASSQRDIGFHFPDTDPQYKGIDSKLLLKEVLDKVHHAGYQIGNIDATVCLQAPKISKLVPQMAQCLSQIIGIPVGDISIKATTTERLGFVGKEEGVSALAVVLIFKD